MEEDAWEDAYLDGWVDQKFNVVFCLEKADFDYEEEWQAYCAGRSDYIESTSTPTQLELFS